MVTLIWPLCLIGRSSQLSRNSISSVRLIISQAMPELDEETQRQIGGSLVGKELSTDSDRPVLRLADDPDEGSD